MKTVKRKDNFPSWANYIAKDSNGEKWFYEYKPFYKSWRNGSWAIQPLQMAKLYKQGKPTNKPEKKIWKIVE